MTHDSIGDGLSYGEVVEALLPLEEVLLRPINPTIYGRKEFSKKRKANNSFINRVMEKEKILIKGDEHGIEHSLL